VAKPYENPRYYEIAFSFRDIPHEVSVFEEAIERYSKIPVRRVLELGCGNAPHLEELAARGYAYVGVDTSAEMLAYAETKAQRADAAAEFLEVDMVGFGLDEPVDFAYNMLGSLYLKSAADLVSHFDAIAAAVRVGGLYFLDWCVEFTPVSKSSQTWHLEDGAIRVDTTYATELVDSVEQLFEETMKLEVDDAGDKKTLVGVTVRRAVYPQEFLFFLAGRSDFEFVGWWNNWDLSRPLDGTIQIDRPIIVTRRT
jgi:SAM-dependent methyltransferase